MAGEIESRTGLRFGRNEGICNNYDWYAKNSNEQSRQHARTDGESKQRDENSYEEPKRRARIQKRCIRNYCP